ncbi:MAG: sigma-E processing peptidase SpoIIGA [Oscillospiraceae bacterium]
MKTVVYVDVLIIVNAIVDYFLLRVTALITGEETKNSRLSAAAFIGALTSLTFLLGELNTVFSIALKVGSVTLLCAVAFGAGNKVRLIKNCAIMFAVSTAFAGIIILLEQRSKSFAVSNFNIYIDISPLFLIVTIIVIYLVLYSSQLLFSTFASSGKSLSIKINVNGKSVNLFAMRDTGNLLRDPVGNREVILVSKKHESSILSPNQMLLLRNFETSIKGSELPFDSAGKISAIPFNTISGKGVLLGFCTESCEVFLKNKKILEVEKPFIAFCDDEYMREFDAIIGFKE